MILHMKGRGRPIGVLAVEGVGVDRRDASCPEAEGATGRPQRILHDMLPPQTSYPS